MADRGGLKWWQRRIGRVSRVLDPGSGQCLRCHTIWLLTAPRVTYWSATDGIFPLCWPCWLELTPETRWPFYETLLSRWINDGARRAAIERTVMDGG